MKLLLVVVVGLATGALVLLRSWSGSAAATAPPLPDTAVAASSEAVEGESVATDPLDVNRALTTMPELEEARASHQAGADEALAAVDEATGEGAVEAALALALLSDVERRLGEDDAALASADRAIELAPEDGLAHFMRAKALGRKLQTGGMLYAMKNLGAYKEAMSRSIELDPGNIDARVEQAAFYMIAPKIVGGDVETGRTLATALEPAAPERAAWLFAMALRAEEKPEEAEATCRAALESFPEDQDLRASLASVLVELERLDEAVIEYERALEGPRGVSYYRVLYEFGRMLGEAERTPERVIEVMGEYIADVPIGGDFLPPTAGAHWRIGQAHELLERTAEAREAYERALAEDPEMEQAAEALEALGA